MQTPPNPNIVRSTGNVKPKQRWKKRGKYCKRAPDGWRKVKHTELVAEGDLIWNHAEHKFQPAEPLIDWGEFAGEYQYVIRKK